MQSISGNRNPPASKASDADIDDPYAGRHAQTFPRLSEEMVSRVAAYGKQETLASGTHVFDRGQRGVDFFLILDGRIDIFESDSHAHGEPHLIVSHQPGQFTGELDLFNDREILVSGRAAMDTRVLRLKRADFRRMVAGEPDIGEVITRAYILRRVGLIRYAHGGVVLIGPGHDADTLRLQRFLTRNGYPHRLIDSQTDTGAEGFLECLDLSPDQLPVVILPDHRVLQNPQAGALADQLGLTEMADPSRVHDVTVVGAGPAGLAAAVYAASEGLDTVVIEALAPGGQAGTSSKIENYLGFPTGISGQALAGRAQIQAQKFGARLAISRSVVAIDCDQSPFRLHLEDGQVVQSRAVVIASGARYRRLEVPGHEKFEGQGIHYAATAMEANLCSGEEVIVVGGGNSAGQAAVFLARTAKHVHILVRATGLAATMSDYLVQRIDQNAHITLHARTEITALGGDKAVHEVTWTNRDTGDSETRAIANVFVMIGAEPNTDWLGGCLALDANGFVCTGPVANGEATSAYETSHAGIFAVGDVRAESVKRVASGVGEGSVVIHSVHRFLNPPPT